MGIPLVESKDVVPAPRLRFCCLSENDLVAGGGNEIDRYVNLVLGCPVVYEALQHRIGRRYPVIPDAHRQLASGAGRLNMHQRKARADGASGDLQHSCHGLLLPTYARSLSIFSALIPLAPSVPMRFTGHYTAFRRLLFRS